MHVAVETHCVPLQVCPLLQLAHAPPPVPHALTEVPERQTFSEQHPVGQVVALQVELETHWVPLQACPLPQVAHAPPPAPHALVVRPGWQTPPSQQPSGQVVALHVEPPLHRPALHVCPLAHTPQVAPLPPHAEVAVPTWQTLPWQQPSGQFSGLQVEPPEQRPLLQVWPAPQALHVAPPAPQVVVVRPVSQRLPLQQPWQLLALQVLPAH